MSKFFKNGELKDKNIISALKQSAIDYNKLANAVHKYSYIKTKETIRELLEKIAYEYEYAYCNRNTKWFERICEEYDIDINLFY